MTSAPQKQKLTDAELLHKGMSTAVMVNTALIVVGLLLTPTTLTARSGSALALAGTLFLVFLYGVAPAHGPLAVDRLPPSVLRYGIIAGLIIGAGFAVQIAGEYLAFLSEGQAVVLRVAVYGCVLLIVVSAAVLTAYRPGGSGYGVHAALWSAMIGVFIWLAVALLALYVFRGTAQGDHVLDYTLRANFVRSGETDFHAFVMGNALGIAFLHLLLMPVVALICGALGGVIGARLARGAQKMHT